MNGLYYTLQKKIDQISKIKVSTLLSLFGLLKIGIYLRHRIRKWKLSKGIIFNNPPTHSDIEEFIESDNYLKLNLIILTPHGRSGSFFFQSLLDSHEEIVSFPAMYRYDFPEIISNWKTTLLDQCAYHPSFFDTSKGTLSKVGRNVTSAIIDEKGTQPKVDTSKFISYAANFFSLISKSQSKTISRKNFIIGTHIALHKSLGFDISKLKYILIHFHNYSETLSYNHYQALDDFPDLFYFALVRDPREFWLGYQKRSKILYGSAYRDHSEKLMQIFMYKLKTYVKHLLEFARHIEPDRLIILDLNKFHKANRAAMIYFSKKLNLTYSDVLTKSTFLGCAWKGNSSDYKEISGFDPRKAILQWPSQLLPEDIEHINSNCLDELTALRYPISVYLNSPSDKGIYKSREEHNAKSSCDDQSGLNSRSFFQGTEIY